MKQPFWKMKFDFLCLKIIAMLYDENCTKSRIYNEIRSLMDFTNLENIRKYDIMEKRYNDGSHYTKDEHGRFTGSTSSGGGSSSSGNVTANEVASNAHERNKELEELVRRCINEPKPVFADGALKTNYLKIPPEDGKYIMAMHGNPKEVLLFGTTVNEKILANIIKSRKDYNGEEIVLISCNTGNTEKVTNCFAQKLADKLNKVVYAPTNYGAISQSGKYFSSDETGRHEIGSFVPFTPNEKSDDI